MTYALFKWLSSFSSIRSKPRRIVFAGKAFENVVGIYELLENILENLEVTDLIGASLVSKEWNSLILSSPLLYQRLVRFFKEQQPILPHATAAVALDVDVIDVYRLIAL